MILQLLELFGMSIVIEVVEFQIGVVREFVLNQPLIDLLTVILFCESPLDISIPPLFCFFNDSSLDKQEVAIDDLL